MKKISMVIVLATVFGLALAAGPALAAGEQVAGEQSDVPCPFYSEHSMTYEDMERWMDSGAHNGWMDSADRDRIRAQMGDVHRMMDGYRDDAGSMRGMMGGGNMMDSSG